MIGKTENNHLHKSITVTMLCDTGSSHNLMSWKSYLELSSGIASNLERSNYVLNLATRKHKLEVQGEAYLSITFYDRYNKKSIEIPQNFLIIKDLQNEAFLGATFLRSDYVYITTRSELVITLDPTSQFPINKLTNSEKLLIVPLNEHKPKTTQDSRTRHSKKDNIYDVIPIQRNQYLTQAKIIKRFKLTVNYNINLHPDMVKRIELTKPNTIATCFMIMNLKDKPFRIIETL